LKGAGRAAVAALALLASACIGPGDFRCTEHAQCTANGFCEANGRCSVPDPKCLPSLRRYVHRAGDDADACVPRSCDGDANPSFSAGGGHACAARGGELWCWGRNDHGQLGDGTRTPRALPVRVNAVSGVSAVAAGDAHTCAITGAGVFCWGADDLGQLGDGGGVDHLLPVPVTGVVAVAVEPDATPIAAGRDFSCVAIAGGGVSCWGDDSVGQLGDGNAAAGPHGPAVVANLGDIKSVSALWQHACALSNAGLLTCWGANNKGQIGDGSTTGPRPPTLVNDPSATMPLPVFKQVTTGSAHTCARSASDLYCWGDNSQGQIDQTGPSTPVPTPTPVTGMDVTDPIAVAAGAQHTCVVATGGKVTCWGSNASNQRDGAIPNAVAVYAGQAFSCALADDGAIFCWGDNHFGQLAIGGDTVRATPAPVPGLVHAAAFAAGGAHNCATAQDADGAPALFCWGANGSGQLGTGSLVDANVATRISALEPIGIAAGSAHTCAFPAIDRQLRCWGLGASGQLGLEPGFDMVITVPTTKDLSPPEGGDGVFAVAAGAAHTCVGATISTSVLCFGLDIDGQLGDGRQAAGGPDPVPSFIGVGKPKALAAGDAHTCAVDADGSVWCWGRGDEGQLGDGTGMEHASQTRVTFAAGVASADTIATGAAHTCALAGGAVLCWGRNVDGQVGAPPATPRLAPGAVMGLSGVRALAAGGNHTCAIDDAATVRCWGANESGQLGDGGTTSSYMPVAVAGLTDVDGIVAGGAHSCAHRTDGSVWCWGANTSGQLGDSVMLTSPRPLLARLACQ